MDASRLLEMLTGGGRLAEANCRVMLLKEDHQIRRLLELSGLACVLGFVRRCDAREARGVERARRAPS
jgi:hypothetical protein